MQTWNSLAESKSNLIITLHTFQSALISRENIPLKWVGFCQLEWQELRAKGAGWDRYTKFWLQAANVLPPGVKQLSQLQLASTSVLKSPELVGKSQTYPSHAIDLYESCDTRLISHRINIKLRYLVFIAWSQDNISSRRMQKEFQESKLIWLSLKILQGHLQNPLRRYICRDCVIFHLLFTYSIIYKLYKGAGLEVI